MEDTRHGGMHGMQGMHGGMDTHHDGFGHGKHCTAMGSSSMEEVQITVAEGFRNAGMASMVEGYGTAVLRYGPIAVDGGTSRLCWCYVAECLELKDFGSDFRTLTPIGPERQEGKTGMSGQQCHFQGLIGQHLSADNKLLRPPLPL